MESLYNQLYLQFFNSQSETWHKCYRHIEDGTSLFEEKKIIFNKITAFLGFEILQFLAETLLKGCTL